MDSDDSLLQLLFKGDSRTIIELYKECFPAIKQLVVKNSGQPEDAEDVFQEALVVLYKRVKSKNLILNCTLSTYLYSICRNMWLDRLRRSGREVGIIDNDKGLVAIDDDTIETIFQNERNLLYQQHFKLIGEGCQKLLLLFFKGVTMKVIAKKMGFGSEQYTRKRKFLCKEKLINSIKGDPVFAELKHGNSLPIDTIKLK